MSKNNHAGSPEGKARLNPGAKRASPGGTRNDRRMHPDSHAMRLLKAFAVILAFFCMIPGIDAVLHLANHGPGGQAGVAAIDSKRLALTHDPVGALDAFEGSFEVGVEVLPKGFEDEIGLLPGGHDVRANDDGSVVGCVVGKTEKEAYQMLVDHMEQKGWSAVPLGIENGATFMKEGGNFTWVLATCTQVGNETSIVYRSVTS